MKAFDALLDSKLSDTRLDSQTSWCGNYESTEQRLLHEQFLLDKTQKQNMAVFSSCLAMISPIMPIGFLSSIFALGKLDAMDNGPLALLRRDSLKAETMRIIAAEALMGKNKRVRIFSDNNSTFGQVSPPLDMRTLSIGLGGSRMSDKQVLPKRHAKPQLDQSFFMTRDKVLKTKNLRKKKMFLELLKDKEREAQKFSEVSSISSKIELLDKLLKRLEK